jgi:hypothetical protein
VIHRRIKQFCVERTFLKKTITRYMERGLLHDGRSDRLHVGGSHRHMLDFTLHITLLPLNMLSKIGVVS